MTNQEKISQAEKLIELHLDRLIEWSVGDIKKCCRMNKEGIADKDGALVGAFILWVCSIDYLGGLCSGSNSNTRQRYDAFIKKYMKRYDSEKVYDLRWSLAHYYSPKHYSLYHQDDLNKNKDIHLSEVDGRILLHLGWAIKDLEDAVVAYKSELNNDEKLKIKLWEYYNENFPIMPLKLETSGIFKSFNSLPTGSTITNSSVFNVSGTVSKNQWDNSDE